MIRSFLLGGLIGAGLALMMTPRSGEETKAELRRRARDLQGRTGDMVEQGRLRATELIRSGQQMLDERIQQGQELVNTAAERAKHNLEANEPRAEEAVNRTADRMQSQQGGHQGHTGSQPPQQS